jgi:hypothetical protein
MAEDRLVRCLFKHSVAFSGQMRFGLHLSCRFCTVFDKYLMSRQRLGFEKKVGEGLILLINSVGWPDLSH